VAQQPSPQQATGLVQVYTETLIIFEKSFRLHTLPDKAVFWVTP
jgi:hypothetical protein